MKIHSFVNSAGISRISPALNVRMKQVLTEVDSKELIIKKLRDDLDQAEVAIAESQKRENRLEDQLDLAKREVRRMRNELLQISGKFYYVNKDHVFD